jgi:hypothetical protein
VELVFFFIFFLHTRAYATYPVVVNPNIYKPNQTKPNQTKTNKTHTHRELAEAYRMEQEEHRAEAQLRAAEAAREERERMDEAIERARPRVEARMSEAEMRTMYVPLPRPMYIFSVKLRANFLQASMAIFLKIHFLLSFSHFFHLFFLKKYQKTHNVVTTTRASEERAARERAAVAEAERMARVREHLKDKAEAGVERDADRVMQPTAASSAEAGRRLGTIDQYAYSGYNDDQVLADKRVKLSLVLGERGLAGTEYGRHAIASASPATAPRYDNFDAGQRAIAAKAMMQHGGGGGGDGGAS